MKSALLQTQTSQRSLMPLNVGLSIIFLLNIYINIMFCCTRKQSHKGEIVNAVCLQTECINSKNQLCCVNCIQEEHASHQITTMRKMLPQLLESNRQKTYFQSKMQRLMSFVNRQFGEQGKDGELTTLDTIVQRTIDLLNDLKNQVELNNEEVNKMKSIFKNLNKNTTQSIFKNGSPSKINTQEDKFNIESPTKNNPSNFGMKSGLVSQTKSKLIQSNNASLSFDTFSHSSKHPYLNISQDMRTVVKVSHSGHRFAAVGAKIFTKNQHQLRLKIDKSISGNIMVGLCHESVVKQKQFANCYGINNGTYIIGQNGNNPITAISFHHSLTVMNRKQIVGWNFQAGDEVVVGLNFDDEFIYFRREGKRGVGQQFTMKISNGDVKAEHKQLIDQGFRLVVLLQSEGDQITISDHY